MKPYHRKFILQLLIISILAGSVLLLLSSKLNLTIEPIIASIGLLFIVNSFAFIFVSNSRERNPRGFVYSYMLVTFGRLIICAAFVFLYTLTHRPFAKPFAISFLMLYFIYSIIEIRAIYTFFKA